MSALAFIRTVLSDGPIPRAEYRIQTVSGERIIHLPERRIGTAVAPVNYQERATPDAPAGVFGTAIVFGARAELVPGVFEEIDRGAVRRALVGNPDIVVLNSHNIGQPLGRTGAGTARVWTDQRGLRYHATPPAGSAYAEDLMRSLKRGDVNGSSFAFQPTRERWSDVEDGLLIEVLDMRLFEVSPTAIPAYTATDSYGRTMAEAELREKKQREHRELVARCRREAMGAKP